MTVSFGTQYLSPLWKATKSFTHNYANFVLGVEQSEVFSKELQKSVRGVKDPLTKKYIGGNGFKNLKGDLTSAWTKSAKVVENKSLWTVIKESFSKIPQEFKAASRLSTSLKAAGKSGKMFGSTLKILGKRMPLVGNLIFAATLIPNIITAFKEGGVGTGLAEIGKGAANFGGFAAGAAIGQAIIPIPFVGAMIGGIVGGWIADKIVGKSYTDKKEEAQAKTAGATAGEEVQPRIARPQERTAAQAPRQYQQNQQALQEQMIQQSAAGQYPNFNAGMSNPFAYAQPNYSQGAYPQIGSNPMTNFDMNGDFLGQATFGTGNNAYGYPKQQFAR